jgi:chromosome segregation ATPase
MVTIEVMDERRSDYPSELDWAAVRAERDQLREKVARRSRRVADLERTLAQEVNRNTDLEAENQRLARQVCEFDRDRHTERDRADKAQDALIKVRAEREEQDKELRRRASAFKVLEGRYETLLAAMDKNDDSAAEAAAEHRRSIAARDNLLSAATTRLNAAREILLATAVSRARDEIVTTKGAVLADAIGNALDALEG